MKTIMMNTRPVNVFLLPNVHGYNSIIERIGIIHSKVIARLYSNPRSTKNSI